MASSILYETRGITAGVDASDYAASWAAQSSSISSSFLSDFNGTTPGYNSFAHLQVDFTLNPVSDFIFEIAPDAGYGGELFLDGTQVDHEATDLWWSYDFNASAELLTSASLGMTAASHVFEAYWAEGCCSGGQAGRFSLDHGATWNDLTTDNLNRLDSVPEPSVMALFGLGLVGIAAARRRKD